MGCQSCFMLTYYNDCIFLKVSRHVTVTFYFNSLIQREMCSWYRHCPDQWKLNDHCCFYMYTSPKFYLDPVPQQAVCGGHFNVVSFRQNITNGPISSFPLYAHGQKLVCIVLSFLNDFLFCQNITSIICKFMGFESHEWYSLLA